MTGSFVTFSIPRRYNGPPETANGGYACGVFAGLSSPDPGVPVAVVLHAPPPLDHAMTWHGGSRRAQVRHGDRLIAVISPASAVLPVVAPLSVAAAREAALRFEGHQDHPFPTCFVCGIQRTPMEGFPIRPGKVAGTPGLIACTWTPDGDPAADLGVRPELVWSVLDCPGGWTGNPATEPMVLTRMTVVIHHRPQQGETHVVVARATRRLNRTTTVGTALYDSGANLMAKASAVWTAVSPNRRPQRGPVAGTTGRGEEC